VLMMLILDLTHAAGWVGQTAGNSPGLVVARTSPSYSKSSPWSSFRFQCCREPHRCVYVGRHPTAAFYVDDEWVAAALQEAGVPRRVLGRDTAPRFVSVRG
jgi:hypothetical protein